MTLLLDWDRRVCCSGNKSSAACRLWNVASRSCARCLSLPLTTWQQQLHQWRQHRPRSIWTLSRKRVNWQRGCVLTVRACIGVPCASCYACKTSRRKHAQQDVCEMQAATISASTDALLAGLASFAARIDALPSTGASSSVRSCCSGSASLQAQALLHEQEISMDS